VEYRKLMLDYIFNCANKGLLRRAFQTYVGALRRTEEIDV
jgi:hypothetical protein